jgi:plasmid stabilization system protein ParE
LTLPLILSPEARADFDETFDWYERQRSGLGADFAARVQAVLDLIVSRPEFFALRAQNVRRALVRRFPYSVYYRPEEEQIVVLAIVHPSRDASVWHERL